MPVNTKVYLFTLPGWLIAYYNTMSMDKRLTHLDESGRAKMVDVGQKSETARVAKARGAVVMQPETLQLSLEGDLKKGNVLNVAEVAGIMAAKQTSALIPLCHPLLLNKVEVSCTPDLESSSVLIESTVRVKGKTGVEMEALTAVSVAALTIYDMVKAVDRGIRLTDIRVVLKEGGKSGTYEAP